MGSSPHLAAELFKALARVNIVRVPYKGAGPASTDLMGGQIGAVMESLPTAVGYFSSGSMRPLAVSEDKSSPKLP